MKRKFPFLSLLFIISTSIPFTLSAMDDFLRRQEQQRCEESNARAKANAAYYDEVTRGRSLWDFDSRNSDSYSNQFAAQQRAANTWFSTYSSLNPSGYTPAGPSRTLLPPHMEPYRHLIDPRPNEPSFITQMRNNAARGLSSVGPHQSLASISQPFGSTSTPLFRPNPGAASGNSNSRYTPPRELTKEEVEAAKAVFNWVVTGISNMWNTFWTRDSKKESALKTATEKAKNTTATASQSTASAATAITHSAPVTQTAVASDHQARQKRLEQEEAHRKPQASKPAQPSGSNTQKLAIALVSSLSHATASAATAPLYVNQNAAAVFPKPFDPPITDPTYTKTAKNIPASKNRANITTAATTQQLNHVQGTQYHLEEGIAILYSNIPAKNNATQTASSQAKHNQQFVYDAATNAIKPKSIHTSPTEIDVDVTVLTREDLLINPLLQTQHPEIVKAFNIQPRDLTRGEIIRDPKLIAAVHRHFPKLATQLELPMPSPEPNLLLLLPSNTNTPDPQAQKTNNEPKVKTEPKPEKKNTALEASGLGGSNVQPIQGFIGVDSFKFPDLSRPQPGQKSWAKHRPHNPQHDPTPLEAHHYKKEGNTIQIYDEKSWQWLTIYTDDPVLKYGPIVRFPEGIGGSLSGQLGYTDMHGAWQPLLDIANHLRLDYDNGPMNRQRTIRVGSPEYIQTLEQIAAQKSIERERIREAQRLTEAKKQEDDRYAREKQHRVEETQRIEREKQVEAQRLEQEARKQEEFLKREAAKRAEHYANKSSQATVKATTKDRAPQPRRANTQRSDDYEHDGSSSGSGWSSAVNAAFTANSTNRMEAPLYASRTHFSSPTPTATPQPVYASTNAACNSVPLSHYFKPTGNNDWIVKSKTEYQPWGAAHSYTASTNGSQQAAQQKLHRKIEKAVADLKNVASNDLTRNALSQAVTGQAQVTPNNSYTQACAQAIESTRALSSYLEQQGFAQQAMAMHHLATALRLASPYNSNNNRVSAAFASMENESIARNVKIALHEALHCMQAASIDAKEKLVNAYRAYRTQPNEQKIRDLAMAGVAVMLCGASVSPMFFAAATEHLIHVLSTEIATIGAPGPIACSWQAIVDDIAATTVSRPATASSGSNTLSATAAAFQAPVVVQPSIMTAHMQALQSGANAAVGAAQPSTTAAGPTGVQAQRAANVTVVSADTKITTEFVTQKLSQSKELQILKDRANQLRMSLGDTKIPRLERFDMTVKQMNDLELRAKQMYDEIRACKDDVAKISRNLDIPEEIIKKIKDHLFYEEHILHGRIQKFDPSIDQSFVWSRLTKGDFVKSDIDFLLHEYAESSIMQGNEVSYKSAHDIIEKLYPWWSNLS